jgi:hypothetical protein
VKEIGRAIGLNVHLDFCEIAICEDGKVRSAGRVASTPEALAVLAESLLPSDRVALEVICAASFLAAIGNIRRFKTSRQLAAYLGLTGRCVIRPPARGRTWDARGAAARSALRAGSARAALAQVFAFASGWAAGRAASVIDRAGLVLAARTFPVRSSLGVEVNGRVRGASGSYPGSRGSRW